MHHLTRERDTSTRFFSIQYLRALAALLVVCVHAGTWVGDSLPPVIRPLINHGHAGVDLFFVISGFIIWTITRTRPVAPVVFLWKRILRIVPLYWTATVMWIIFALVAGFERITLTPAHIVKSLSFVAHYSPSYPDEIWPVLIPGWTLTYEMSFYILCALILVLPTRARLSALVSVLMCLPLLGLLLAPENALLRTYTSPLGLEFLAGCLVAELRRHIPGSVGRNLIVLGCALALYASLGNEPHAQNDVTRTLFYGLPAALLVSACIGLQHLTPRLTRLEMLGDASYAIYLGHLFVVVPMGVLWTRMTWVHSDISSVAFVLMALMGSCWLGTFLHHYFDQPLQRRLARSRNPYLRGATIESR